MIHTSTPSLRMDSRTAEAIKAANPDIKIAFVGGHPTAAPEETLKISSAIDIAGRKEFDQSMVEVAQGVDWSKIDGISYRKNGMISHNPDRPVMTGEELDRLPFVTEIYERISTTCATTVRTASIPTCRFTLAADARRSAPFACGRK